jgi:hypothetical protein
VSEAEIDLRAKEVGEAIMQGSMRRRAAGRLHDCLLLNHPLSRASSRALNLFADYLKEKGAATSLRVITEPGFVGGQHVRRATKPRLATRVGSSTSYRRWTFTRRWPPVVIRDPKETRQKRALSRATSTATEMDDFTDLIERACASASYEGVARGHPVRADFLLIPRSASPHTACDRVTGHSGARNILRRAVNQAVGKNFSIDPSG